MLHKGSEEIEHTSIGCYRVGIGFNPSGDADVAAIKGQAAALIDLCHAQMLADAAAVASPADADRHAEIKRLFELAMDRIEEAAMWAVKAITKP